MEGRELLRTVALIEADRHVPRERVFQALAESFTHAYQLIHGARPVTTVIDRKTGEVRLHVEHEDGTVEVMHPTRLGRRGLQHVREKMLTALRQSEQDQVFLEYQRRLDQLVFGTVRVLKSGVVVVDLGRIEAVLPANLRANGYFYRDGQRIQVRIAEVRRDETRNGEVRVLVSHGDADFLRRVLLEEVSELQDGGSVQLHGVARESGLHAKIAVSARRAGVNPVAVCIGVRGARIRNVVEALGTNEKIDVVLWDADPKTFIQNALALRAPVVEIEVLDAAKRQAVVRVRPDQRAMVIGARGVNIRLTSELTGWDLRVEDSIPR